MGLLQKIISYLENAGRDAEIDAALKDINSSLFIAEERNIVFLGSINPSFINLYNELQLKLDYNAIWLNYLQKLPFIYGMKFPVPARLRRQNFTSISKTTIFSKIKYVNSASYLAWSFRNIKENFPDNDSGAIASLIFEMELYCRGIIDILRPKLCMIWNGFLALNKVMAGAAQRQNIPILYIESGNLPGTVHMETWGQMGESRPARDAEWFLNLPLLEEDTRKAERTIDFLCRSGLNRNIQRKKNEDWLKKIKHNRPIMLYAGQNDVENGIVPHDGHAETYHSPSFASSYDAMRFLAPLAERNNWNLIYKPHPIMHRWQIEKGEIPDNVIMVSEGDINDLIDLADVVVTIVSTVSYIAMIRNKPVVMLGYIQLRGQGCTYEAFERDAIEDALKKAVADGFSKAQRRAFLEHAARLCKYYLFDNMQNREHYYGRPGGEALRFLHDAIDGKAEY